MPDSLSDLALRFAREYGASTGNTGDALIAWLKYELGL